MNRASNRALFYNEYIHIYLQALSIAHLREGGLTDIQPNIIFHPLTKEREFLPSDSIPKQKQNMNIRTTGSCLHTMNTPTESHLLPKN